MPLARRKNYGSSMAVSMGYVLLVVLAAGLLQGCAGRLHEASGDPSIHADSRSEKPVLSLVIADIKSWRVGEKRRAVLVVFPKNPGYPQPVDTHAFTFERTLSKTGSRDVSGKKVDFSYHVYSITPLLAGEHVLEVRLVIDLFTGAYVSAKETVVVLEPKLDALTDGFAVIPPLTHSRPLRDFREFETIEDERIAERLDRIDAWLDSLRLAALREIQGNIPLDANSASLRVWAETVIGSFEVVAVSLSGRHAAIEALSDDVRILEDRVLAANHPPENEPVFMRRLRLQNAQIERDLLEKAKGCRRRIDVLQKNLLDSVALIKEMKAFITLAESIIPGGQIYGITMGVVDQIEGRWLVESRK